MRKKLLCFLLCVVLVIGLTACGNKNSQTKDGSNTSSSSSGSNKEATSEITVTNLYASSSNYAVVKGEDNNKYIIDKEGKMQGKITIDIVKSEKKDNITISNNNDKVKINKNGYIYYSNYGHDKSMIIDKNGKTIYEGTSTISYTGITDDNYTLRRSETSDYEKGTSIKYELIDMEGNVIKEVDSSSYLDEEESDCITVNEDYCFNSDDSSFYDNNGTKVKEITSGNGLSSVYYEDDKYYACSNTKYCYVMNTSFETIVEPFQTEISNIGTVGKDCVITYESESFNDGTYSGSLKHFYLYNFDGKLVEDLGKDWGKVSASGFVATIERQYSIEYNERTGANDTIYMGSQISDSYVNLHLGEVLKIYQ